MNESRDFRKLQVALNTRGQGVIIFAIWGCIEVFLVLFSNDDYLPTFENYVEKWFALAFMFIICLVTCAINLLINMYIGRSAIKYSHGADYMKKPIVFSGIYAGFVLVMDIAGMFIYLEDGIGFMEVVSFITDIFVVVLHAQIVVFALKLKKLEA